MGLSVTPETALRTLRAADVHFDYLWRRMAIRVSSTWNLMRLTLLAAGFITASGFFPTLQALSYGNRSSSITIAGLDQAMYETGVWALAQLGLGFAVAGVLCFIAMVLDGLLQRRLVSWKYFYATTRDALSDGQSP
jgi:TM2 domain-containing membrane protein YozV